MSEDLGLKRVKLLSETTSEGIERTLWMSNAFDLRVTPSGKNYGIHGAELTFMVQRGNCGIEWRLMTPFHLPHVRRELETKHRVQWHEFDGLGDISYHSPVPSYEGQTGREDCDITGGVCYSDGTSLGSCELFDKAVADPEVVWKDLEERLGYIEARVKSETENRRNFS